MVYVVVSQRQKSKDRDFSECQFYFPNEDRKYIRVTRVFKYHQLFRVLIYLNILSNKIGLLNLKIQ